MITFKDFLTESRSAPLYHATGFDNAMSIFYSNEMIRSYDLDPGVNKRTISLTRNLIFARNWIRKNGGVIFVLNQDKISQRYKIRPYNYFGHFTFTSSNGVSSGKSNQKELVTRHLPKVKTYSKGKDYTKENEFEEIIFQDIKPIRPMIDKVLIHPYKGIIEDEDFVEDLKQAGIKVEILR